MLRACPPVLAFSFVLFLGALAGRRCSFRCPAFLRPGGCLVLSRGRHPVPPEPDILTSPSALGLSPPRAPSGGPSPPRTGRTALPFTSWPALHPSPRQFLRPPESSEKGETSHTQCDPVFKRTRIPQAEQDRPDLAFRHPSPKDAWEPLRPQPPPTDLPAPISLFPPPPFGEEGCKLVSDSQGLRISPAPLFSPVRPDHPFTHSSRQKRAGAQPLQGFAGCTLVF